MKKQDAKRLKKADKKSAKNKQGQAQNELFNFDNEIVIGVTKLPEPKKAKKSKKKVQAKKNKKMPKVKEQKQKEIPKVSISKKQKSKPNKKIDLKKEKRKRRIISFLKGVLTITVIIGAFLALMLSPLFNIKEIKVQGNSKITEQEIIELSKINIGENLFLVNNNIVIKQIENNPYIEDVKINKQLPNGILIEIKERKATYALKYNDKYVYINNQGYILEEAENINDLPEIISYKTPIEQIKIGGRLLNEDLELLGTVLKIMETANNNELGNLITSIDIGNKNDIILRIDSERKNRVFRKCFRHKHKNDVYKSNNK